MSLVFHGPAPAVKRPALAATLAQSETAVVEALLLANPLDAAQRARIEARARGLVAEVRRQRDGIGGLDAFLREFSLSSREGVVLMCLAEALLRIPDAETADLLIKDKVGEGDWAAHLGHSNSLFVNASTWALMLTGRVMKLEGEGQAGLRSLLGRMVAASGEPVIRRAVTAAMRILGRQFVMGRTIQEGLERAAPSEPKGWRHSYDMLGESARCKADARRYFEAYAAAIAAIGKASAGRGPIDGPGISVKLSALHPRYEVAQADRVRGELVPALIELARLAKAQGIGFTVDAEEAERLDLSLDLIAAALDDAGLAGWDGFGLAVQAYQTRARGVVAWLAEAAASRRRRIMVRLVKGAYWDSEIKRAQERGLAFYPVFTRKASTDLSYLVCAGALLDAEWIYPQFATHNAHTLAAVEEMAGNRPFEYQRLHGMGESLYEQIVTPGRPCRIYAPVGSHEDLLPYLVRRLLENGANTSFVNRIADEAAPIEDIVADPVMRVASHAVKPHPRIPVPPALYGAERRNAAGLDLNDLGTLATLKDGMERALAAGVAAGPIVGGVARTGIGGRTVFDPADRRRAVGQVSDASPADVAAAIGAAVAAQPAWDATPAAARAAALERTADLLEDSRHELLALVVREGGRTIPDALSELREAVDFCRYYAARARADFAAPVTLAGPTGGRNQIALHGRGRLRLHQPVELPARDLYRPGRRGARRRQRGGRQAGRADAAGRRARGGAHASRRRARRRAASAARRRHGRPHGRRRSARRRRRLHRFDRHRARDRTVACRPRRAAGDPDRGNRRPERDDRRFLGARGAGGRRCHSLGLQQCRPALFGAARHVPPGRHRRPRPAPARRGDGRTRHRRSRVDRDRCRPGDRRAGARGARPPLVGDPPHGHRHQGMPAPGGHGARHFLRAARGRDRFDRAPDG